MTQAAEYFDKLTRDYEEAREVLKQSMIAQKMHILQEVGLSTSQAWNVLNALDRANRLEQQLEDKPDLQRLADNVFRLEHNVVNLTDRELRARWTDHVKAGLGAEQ